MYSADKSFTVEDMSMLVCKDVGCAVNYCTLLKRYVPMEWEGTDDCGQEMATFSKCMVAEQRRYHWSANKPNSLYEYAW